jgi:hypothetical protein
MQKRKTFDYRGYQIATWIILTRFGEACRVVTDIGEPEMIRSAYNSEEEAVQVGRTQIDDYLAECGNPRPINGKPTWKPRKQGKN